MKRLRNKMTSEELAECLGVAKQTVNRWIREKGWKTESMVTPVFATPILTTSWLA
ncbi:helix-turn-helix domain-containing protein [Escherichia coli]|nr:helix-turn-helix domain-containing protein [Escherichia coli]EFC5133601.1 putative DNA-binding transcriptional regulator [Escherichia coli]TXW53193.1 helix-turn-helix domain-containing protein [Escherichia coli]